MSKKNIVESNIGLVRSVVSKFVKENLEDSDLFSIGCEGLIKAAGTFDSSKSKFSTWATRIIKQKIIDELRKNKKNNINSFSSLGLEKEDQLVESKQISNFPSHIICSIIKNSKDEEKKIVNLYYLEQKTLSDIAKQLKISKEGVRKKIQRAITNIRGDLVSKGF